MFAFTKNKSINIGNRHKMRGPISAIRYRLLVHQLMMIDGDPASLTLSFIGAGRNIKYGSIVKSFGRPVHVTFLVPHSAYYERTDREIAEYIAPQVAPQVGIVPPRNTIAIPQAD